MIPYLVTPPASLPVSLADMKVHLRVDHTEEDAAILEQQAAAVAHLDGWGGVLGRCIMPQVWSVDVTGPGLHVLPFPDATGVTALSGGSSVALATTRTGLGLAVEMADLASDSEATITATYGLPATRLPAAAMLVKLLVGHWYQHREAVTDASMSALPMAADALIAALRWRPV
jgi:uncharacterized phiE125 gp8 family phage protein